MPLAAFAALACPTKLAAKSGPSFPGYRLGHGRELMMSASTFPYSDAAFGASYLRIIKIGSLAWRAIPVIIGPHMPRRGWDWLR